jgi:hypothetical protein
MGFRGFSQSMQVNAGTEPPLGLERFFPDNVQIVLLQIGPYIYIYILATENISK